MITIEFYEVCMLDDGWDQTVHVVDFTSLSAAEEFMSKQKYPECYTIVKHQRVIFDNFNDFQTNKDKR